MPIRHARLALAFAVAVAVGSFDVAAAPAKKSIVDSLDIKAETFKLDNGLTLVVHEDHKAPIVAVNVWYHVGSKDEAPGRSGFAHLFEHLMFNGSEHFNTDYFKALGAMGATDLNGTTNRDRTNYFQNVPVSGLDRVLFLESDRMGHLLGVIDQPRLDEQRGVVQNEKRQGENQPYGQAFNEANKVLFPSHHPYAYPRGTVIGSMEDLDAAALKDVQDWFKAWYGPQNATIVIAGDVDPKVVLEKVKRYFGHIPAGPPQPRQGPWAEPLSASVRKVVEDRVPQTRLYRMWVTPDLNAIEHDHLQLAAALLGRGKTSRLFKRLVYTDQIATDVSASVWEGEVASQFIVTATVKQGVDLAKVEAAVDEEFAAFFKNGPKADEFARLKTSTLAAVARGLERIGGFGGKSDLLARSVVFSGSTDAWKRSLVRFEEATPAQVQAAARRWLDAPRLDLVVKPFSTFKNAAAGVDRSTLPDLGQAPVASFPTVQRATLKNGLKVILVERKGLPVVDVRLLLPRGTSSDTPATAGLARLAMNALDEGTTKRSAIGLAESLDGLGASLSTSTGLETSTVSLQTLKATLDESLALFGEVVLTPSFPPADVERLKQQQLAAIAQEKNSPAGIASRLAPKLVYGAGHPYALPSSGLGFDTTLPKLGRDQIAAWVASTMKPGSTTVVVAGDLTMADVLPRLEKALGRWPTGEVAPVVVPTASSSSAPTIYLVDRPGSLQSQIVVASLAPTTNTPDEIAIEGFNKILGGDFNSRLNMNLREDKHWSYGVRSFLVDARGQRLFTVSAPVQTDKTAESLAELQKEFAAIVGPKPPSSDEFGRIQADRILKLPGQWETLAAVQGAVAHQVTYGLPDDYFQGYAGRLQALKREDVVAVAGKVVKPAQTVWIVVGDRAKIEAGLRALKSGDVKVITVE